MVMSKEYRINNNIKENIIDIVMPDGSMKNGIPLSSAMVIAQEEGLDLIEVSPAYGDRNAICKVLDYGKLKYKESKRKKAHKQVVKEIKFNFNIGDHDLEVKNNKVKNFLDKRYQIKYSVELRGRERDSVGEARKKMEGCLEQFEKIGSWTPIKVSTGGRMTRITTVISPV